MLVLNEEAYFMADCFVFIHVNTLEVTILTQVHPQTFSLFFGATELREGQGVMQGTDISDIFKKKSSSFWIGVLIYSIST